MKKVYLLLFSLLLIIPFGAFAASDPKILTLSAEGSGTKVTYKGTIEEGSYAVMCKLYDSKGEEIDLLSTEVDNKSFTGSFTDVPKGTYTLACANYEGGEVEKIELILDGKTVSAKNPNTYDSGIYINVILLAFSIVGIAVIIRNFKSRELNVK